MDGSARDELVRILDEERRAWLVRFFTCASTGCLFSQNALDDAVKRDDTRQGAGSGPKRVDWYESEDLLPDEAFHRLVDWLATKIGIDASQLTVPVENLK